MKKAILFDLGNTLVRYFERAEFDSILEEAILGVRGYLLERELPPIPPEMMWQRVRDENHEAADHRVRPLEGRLARVFQLETEQSADLIEEMCRRFTAPFFARSCRYPDALPVLRRLRARGVRTALVSNMPWGSPGRLWRGELVRHGLDAWLDLALFCTDAGWRKPAPQIFELALKQLEIQAQDCLFVGDHPQWDVAGAQTVGIEALLIDRRGRGSQEHRMISSLNALEDWL